MNTTIESTDDTSRVRWAVSVAAIIGIAPYVALKAMWLSGSRVGIVDPDFGHGLMMNLLNAATGAMDVIAVILALSFVTAWGRRIPAPFVLLPMWAATGLLGQIALVLPLQLLFGSAPSDAETGAAVLAEWVPTLVYAGFAWQGVFLILGFALYARQRWGAYIDGAGRPRSGAVAVIAVLGTVAVAIVEWTSADRGIDAINAAATALIAVGAGFAITALGVGTRVPRVLPIAVGWLCSGALTAWGAYLTLMALLPTDLRSDAAIDFASVGRTSLRLVVGVVCAAVLLSSGRTRHP